MAGTASRDTVVARDALLPHGLPGTLEELEERTRRYFRQARAENTVRAYRHDLEDFAVWCRVEVGGCEYFSATPETVSLYITDLAGRGLKAATINRRLSAIGQLHQRPGRERILSSRSG